MLSEGDAHFSEGVRDEDFFSCGDSPASVGVELLVMGLLALHGNLFNVADFQVFR